jgi:hypothetical protein
LDSAQSKKNPNPGPDEAHMTAEERIAIRLDAEQRLRELRSVAAALWVDRDDPVVLNELTGVLSQMRAAELALRDAQPLEATDSVDRSI